MLLPPWGRVLQNKKQAAPNKRSMLLAFLVFFLSFFQRNDDFSNKFVPISGCPVVHYIAFIHNIRAMNPLASLPLFQLSIAFVDIFQWTYMIQRSCHESAESPLIRARNAVAHRFLHDPCLGTLPSIFSFHDGKLRMTGPLISFLMESR